MLTLLEAAQQLRVADTEEQAQALPDKALIEGLILTAAEMVENDINQPLSNFATLPSSLKSAMKLQLGTLYNNREEVVIGTASYVNELKAYENLIRPYRVYAV